MALLHSFFFVAEQVELAIDVSEWLSPSIARLFQEAFAELTNCVVLIKVVILCNLDMLLGSLSLPTAPEEPLLAVISDQYLHGEHLVLSLSLLLVGLITKLELFKQQTA